ncbi:MAG: Gfo/Idh/MocA family oxidoreductase [bacterium]
MNKVRIGFIGVGQIGKMHLDAYMNIPGAEVVAAADVNEVELNRVADMYNIPHRYTDFRKLLERDDIDAVDVCLHNNLHMPFTVAALEAGKNVYCEKPIAGSYIDGVKMLETAQKCKRKLSIQLATLFSGETRVAKKLIENDRLGNIYHARSTGFRRRGRPYVDGYGTEFFVKKETAGGGALFDMGVYHIAQILYLIGMPEVTRISGKIHQETDMDTARRAKSGYNVEELGLGLVKFEGGLTMDIIESWAMHLNTFEASYIAGSQGGIQFDPLTYHTAMDGMEMDATFRVDGICARWSDLVEDDEAYTSPQGHWVAALQGRVDLLPTADVALQTMLVSEGIYLSDHLGREVTPEEVMEKSKSNAVKI